MLKRRERHAVARVLRRQANRCGGWDWRRHWETLEVAWRAGVSEGIFEGVKALGQRKDMVEQCKGVSFAVWRFIESLPVTNHGKSLRLAIPWTATSFDHPFSISFK